MKDYIRLTSGIVMAIVIFLLALWVVPFIGFISAAIESSPISYGEVTQITLLIASLILIRVFSKGDFISYGFRLVGLKKLIKSALISITAVILFFIVLNIIMMATGIAADKLGDSGIEKSTINFLVTIVIIASTCEEIFYRGLIYGYMAPLKKYGFNFIRAYISLPVIVCGLMFGLGHFCLIGQMNKIIVISIVISATLLGLIAGYYREKSGSILPAIVAHMTFNIVAFGLPTIMSPLNK